MAKDKNILIRVSLEQREAYESAAKAAGMTLSAWILSRCDETDEERLLRLHPPIIVPAEFIKTPTQAKVEETKPKVPYGSLLKK